MVAQRSDTKFSPVLEPNGLFQSTGRIQRMVEFDFDESILLFYTHAMYFIRFSFGMLTSNSTIKVFDYLQSVI